MTAPRKRGRPAHAPGATTLGVRLTAEQRRALETAAGGLDLSTWVRETLLRAIGRSDLGIAGEARRLSETIADAARLRDEST